MTRPDFHLGPMLRISVFLSVFDVHVNRSPVEGVVHATVYRAGKISRRAASGIEHAQRGAVVVDPKPHTARWRCGRSRDWWRGGSWLGAGEGSILAKGQRFGMIRFGSRTEVFLPIGCVPLVKPGDRVEGAATPIARWPEAS